MFKKNFMASFFNFKNKKRKKREAIGTVSARSIAYYFQTQKNFSFFEKYAIFGEFYYYLKKKENP
jgi:hypothetical protein